jgi:glutathione S-transferase
MEESMVASFTLYGSPHSQFTYKVALMLRLCGESFAFRYISFQKGMQKTPEFRAFSRWGQVPVLQHHGRSLNQSGAILEYLADELGRFAAPDVTARQDVREWLCWNADRLAPPIYGCYGVKLGERGLLPIVVDPILAAYHCRGAETALSVLDEYLQKRDFIAASAPTIADLCCYGETAFARLCEFHLARWPSLSRWAERIEALPGFKRPFDLLSMADADITP